MRICRPQRGELVDRLVNAPDLDTLHELLVGGFGGIRPVQAQQNRINRLMFREAERVANGADCVALMVFGDTFIGGIDAASLPSKLKTILVTRNPIEPGLDQREFNETIQVRSFSNQRMAQLRSAILVALTRGVVSFTDRVCCIGGNGGSNQFDTVIVVDIERVSDSCGYAVPLMSYVGERDLLPAYFERKGVEGSAEYRRTKNPTSLDGLPAFDFDPAPE